MADEDVARLVSLGYAEAMARVALKNEESLEQAAEALAANNGTYQRQVGVVTFEIQWCGQVSTTYFIPASKKSKKFFENFDKLPTPYRYHSKSYSKIKKEKNPISVPGPVTKLLIPAPQDNFCSTGSATLIGDFHSGAIFYFR